MGGYFYERRGSAGYGRLVLRDNLMSTKEESIRIYLAISVKNYTNSNMIHKNEPGYTRLRQRETLISIHARSSKTYEATFAGYFNKYI